MDLDIVPGVVDGATRHMPGLGEPSEGDGPPGDLVIRFRVAEDEVFGREGHHLVRDVEVPFYRAALGGELDVEIPGGRKVTVKIKTGTQHGTILRARGWGFSGRGGYHGDLLVPVKVTIPRELTDQQRKLLELYAETGGAEEGFWDRVKDIFKG